MSEFELDEVQDDGCTLREHLIAVWKSKGKAPRQLEGHELPEHASHVWGYFLDLHSQRQGNGFSEGRITATMIKDWSQVYCVDLDLWEIKAINRIDGAWIKLHAEKSK